MSGDNENMRPPSISALKKLEIFLVVLLVLGAAWLRFGNLTTVPGGFHGDEATVGLEAQRILREGSIGPYSLAALGQPAGPLYLTALSVRFFGPTVWAVRAVSALLGTLTVLLLYLLLRRQRGRTVAMVGAFLLATLDWHIHFSRLSFPIISWPLCVVATTFAALEATRQQKAWLWGLAGALTGIGIYSYNAHIVFILALSVWFVVYLLRQREVLLSRRAGWLLCFVLALGLTVLPMARFAFDPANDYFSHARTSSIFNPSAPGWQGSKEKFTEEKTGVAKLKWLGERAIGFWVNLTYHSQVDGVDSSGVVPAVPVGILVLTIVGWWLTRKQRDELTALTFWCVLLLPIGYMITIEGTTRRAFALAPFLVAMCAVGIVELWKRLSSLPYTGKYQAGRPVVMIGGVALVSIVLAGQSLNDYFVNFAPTPQRAWIFGQDFSDTCVFLATLPPTTHVLFYSNRWGRNYEPRLFLAPDLIIEDRSKQFGTFSFEVNSATKSPVFVLMGLYLQRLPELKKKYPGSRIQMGPPSAETGHPVYAALWPQSPIKPSPPLALTKTHSSN
ncbi:hypothetical protein IAD21_02491 [Abditibacteriota bacterium]|nr:hypothetical protein IAD21_02491 [Abditibacteriota bacterium]